MKIMTIVISCLLCFSSIAHGMDKKSYSKRDKKSHKKDNIPDLDLTVKSSPKDKKPIGMSGSSETPKKQVVIASSTETPKATGTPKVGTPKTPVKSLEDLKRHVVENKLQTARKDDSSTT